MVPETRIDLGSFRNFLKSLNILNLFFNSDNLMNFFNWRFVIDFALFLSVFKGNRPVLGLFFLIYELLLGTITIQAKLIKNPIET